MPQKTDYIIVGQGLAGTLLAWFLTKANASFIIIDDRHKHSSTKIAAGLIHPITGRRFVKSWMIDTLMPFAKQTYTQIEKDTGLSLYTEQPIIRFFQNTAEENNWLTKTAYEGYEKYLSSLSLDENFSDIISTNGYGIVNGAKVEVYALLQYFQQYYLSQKQLLQETFNHHALKVLEDGVEYQDIRAKKIIFCEGYAAYRNPYFQYLPYELAKGEVLVLNIPNFPIKHKVIKKTQFLIPLGKDLFWFGSNYEWDNLDCQPTETGKTYLLNQLSKLLKADYTVINHLAAVRPVLKDRRPVLGFHPSFPNIGIFNGLGTKGTSLAPYWAKKFVETLVDNASLDTEVVLSKFDNLLKG